MSPVPNPMAWKEDTFHHPLDYLDIYNAFPPFALIWRVINSLIMSSGLRMTHESMLALLGVVSCSAGTVVVASFPLMGISHAATLLLVPVCHSHPEPLCLVVI